MVKQRLYTKTGEPFYIWCVKEKDDSLTFGRGEEVTLAKSHYTNEKNYTRDVNIMLQTIKMCYPVYWKELVMEGYVS